MMHARFATALDSRDSGCVDIVGVVSLEVPGADTASFEVVMHVACYHCAHGLSLVSCCIDGRPEIWVAEVTLRSSKVAAPNVIAAVAEAGGAIVCQKDDALGGG